jgi:hypothetical protein
LTVDVPTLSKPRGFHYHRTRAVKEKAMSEYQSAAGFPTTHWSRVLRAADPTDREGRDALERLCSDYWYPLYAFARRQGLDREDAGDLVQGFLADLIERRDLTKADPSRGRFRSFLRTACSHFLSHARDHDRALKRGGGRTAVSIDLQDAEGRYINEPAHERSPLTAFVVVIGNYFVKKSPGPLPIPLTSTPRSPIS